MPRRLIICADGTWNTADMMDGGKLAPTNVTKMARAIKAVSSTGVSQIVYYHEGVGTRQGLDRIFGGAFGSGICKNITDCYRFLVDNYEIGDELFLFGFSRGAYTVRSLAGLIRNSGLLRSEHADKIPEAYALYRDRTPETHPSSPLAQDFRRQHAWDVHIKCIGVWDTVGSLGIPITWLNWLFRHAYQFHDVTLSSRVENAFHAIAIDERRKPFTPTLWETTGAAEQRVEQVWFAGAHSNVGGGFRDNRLADIAFAWMQERAESCGLEFDERYVGRAVSASYQGQIHKSATLWYRPFGTITRTIAARREKDGKPIETHESIHPTARQRHKELVAPPDGPYQPANLIAYIEQLGEDQPAEPAEPGRPRVIPLQPARGPATAAERQDSIDRNAA